MSSKLFKQLIEINKIINNLSSSKDVFTKSVKKVLNLDLNNNSVIDEIKECRVEVKLKYLNKFNKNHKLIDKNVIKFKCNECNQKFSLRRRLLNHKLIHSNERQYVCDWSQYGKQFKTNSHLNQHILQHSGDKPYICDHKNCGKRFTRISSLNYHFRCHSK